MTTQARILLEPTAELSTKYFVLGTCQVVMLTDELSRDATRIEQTVLRTGGVSFVLKTESHAPFICRRVGTKYSSTYQVQCAEVPGYLCNGCPATKQVRTYPDGAGQGHQPPSVTEASHRSAR